MQLEIDFARYPAAKCGDASFDVPLNKPLGELKKALRGMLSCFPEVEGAYLLVYSDPAWGDTPRLIVATAPLVEMTSLYAAWAPYSSEFGPVGFFSGVENRISAFVSEAATPFYRPDQSPPLPAPFSKDELIDYIRLRPDVPALAATAAHLETLKENYDHLTPSEAAAEYEAQQKEMEQTLADLRAQSTHAKAKGALLSYLTENASFGLVLRTFSNETTTGRGPFGKFRRWMGKRPMGDLISRFSPFPLVGVANPNDPFPLADVLLLECNEEWLRAVRSLIAIARKTYVLCDRFSPGVTSEFLAIQAAEREDDAFILLPGLDQKEYYGDLYALTEELDDPGPLHTEVLRRKLATFGYTGTTDEMNRFLNRTTVATTEAGIDN